MDTLVITCGGIGDCILGINAAILIQLKNPLTHVDVLCCVRDEVFDPLQYLFQGKINLIQHSQKETWGAQDGWIIRNQEGLKDFPHKNKYCIWPDLLFRAANLSFRPEPHGLSLSAIKDYRSLLDAQKPTKKIIYLALNTTTDIYKYNETESLIRGLAATLPDYTIYFNDLKKWSSHEINNGQFENLPKNVDYRKNDNFIDSLEVLKESCYCICLDNGISHIARNLGIPRLLITRHLTLQGLPWLSRWYPDLSECIDYSYNPYLIAALVHRNLKTPETLLISRNVVINNLSGDWGRTLGFKY